MSFRKVIGTTFGAIMLIAVIAAPAHAGGNKYEAQLSGTFPGVPVAGEAHLQQTGKQWKSRVTVTGLQPGDYTYAITVNDVVAPGGGGHFTLVPVCTLRVASVTKPATCEGKHITLPSGPIVGASGSVHNSLTAWAQGSFMRSA